VRRKEARIPDAMQFQTKPQLGIAMVRHAIADGLPRGVVRPYGALHGEADAGLRHAGGEPSPESGPIRG